MQFEQKAEVEPSNRSAQERAVSPAFDDRNLYRSAIRDMLEVDDYQIALVSRSEWDPVGASKGESLSPASPAVLLPFSWKQLVARLLSSVPESNTAAPCRAAQFADICVDFIKVEVRRLSGEVISLTHQEFKTLKCFLSNPERVLSRDELLNEAWGYENYPTTRTVDNHVLKLRQKLERDPSRPVHFRTVPRVGYRFVP